MTSLLPQVIANSLVTGSIYALAAAGLALLFSMFRVLNFAHGHLMMVGAYGYLFTAYYVSLPISIALLCAIGVSLGIAAASYEIFFRPFVDKSPLLPFVTTLALGVLLENIIAICFGVNVQSFNIGFDNTSVQILGAFITPIQITTIVVSVCLLGSLFLGLGYSTTGRAVRACAEFPQAAESLGIARARLGLISFCAAGALAAVAGILIGFDSSLTPTMGSFYTIKALAAMVLGGLGNIGGTVVGAFLLALIENVSMSFDFFGYSIPGGYKDAFSFLVIFVVLLLKPEGLLNKRKRAV